MKVSEINAHPRIIDAFLRTCGENKDVEEVLKDYRLLDIMKIRGLGRKTSIEAYCIVQSILRGKNRQLPYCLINLQQSSDSKVMLRKSNTRLNMNSLCKDVELLIKEKYNEEVLVFNGRDIGRGSNGNR